MNRGDVWLAEVGNKRRPVLVLTRTEVLEVRALVTVAEITTTARGLAVEVEFDHASIGIDRPSVINCDGIHTIDQRRLSSRIGDVDADVLDRVCAAIHYAFDC